ncbi:MAG: potassium transporter TrkG [Oscillospiraceae bacterium]
MNYKMVGRVLGMVLLCLTGLMLVSLLAGIIYGENVRPFVLCIALSLALGLGLASIKPDSTDLFARDGFLAVGLAWMLMSLLGALPYILSGDIPDFVDALFESVSGFSTTGATVLTDVETLSRSCMLWRLLSQWIGGMGVLVFMLAVMPMSGEHSMHIVRASLGADGRQACPARARDGEDTLPYLRRHDASGVRAAGLRRHEHL